MMNKVAILCTALAVFSCKNKSDSEHKEQSEPQAPSEQPAENVASAPIDASGPASDPNKKAKVTLEEDLDGDGKPETILIGGGKVQVGTWEAHYPLEGEWAGADVDDDSEDKWSAEIIDLDTKTPGKELALVSPVTEDDATYFIFVFRDGKFDVTDIYTGNAPELRGDGVLRTRNSNCGETQTTEWSIEGAKLVKTDEKKSGKYNEEECAACPMVYVRTKAGVRLAGEILRRLSSPQLAGSQSLELSATDVEGGIVRIRLAEQKFETTRIQDVHLRVGDARIEPREGFEATLLRFGDARELSFDVGTVPPGATIELWATGYYQRDQ